VSERVRVRVRERVRERERETEREKREWVFHRLLVIPSVKSIIVMGDFFFLVAKSETRISVFHRVSSGAKRHGNPCQEWSDTF